MTPCSPPELNSENVGSLHTPQYLRLALLIKDFTIFSLASSMPVPFTSFLSPLMMFSNSSSPNSPGTSPEATRSLISTTNFSSHTYRYHQNTDTIICKCVRVYGNRCHQVLARSREKPSHDTSLAHLIIYARDLWPAPPMCTKLVCIFNEMDKMASIDWVTCTISWSHSSSGFGSLHTHTHTLSLSLSL